MEFIPYIITALASTGTALGVGKIYQMLLARRWVLKDKKIEDENMKDPQQRELIEALQVKHIDAALESFKAVSARLEKVEDRLDKLNEEHKTQMIINEKLKHENELLKRDNKEQFAEVQRLRRREVELSEKVDRFLAIIEGLREEINGLRSS